MLKNKVSLLHSLYQSNFWNVGLVIANRFSDWARYGRPKRNIFQKKRLSSLGTSISDLLPQEAKSRRTDIIINLGGFGIIFMSTPAGPIFAFAVLLDHSLRHKGLGDVYFKI